MSNEYKTNWNLKLLYSSENDPNIKSDRELTERISYKFINKWKNRDDYLKDPKILKIALNEYNNWLSKCGTYDHEGYYYFLKSELNETDPKIKAKLNKIQDLSIKILNDIQFFTLRISKIDKKQQKVFLEDENLSEYKHFLDSLFKNASYLLSESEEKILTLKSSSSYSNWVKMLSSFLSKETAEVIDKNGAKFIKNYSEISSLLSDTNKSIRDSANSAFNKILLRHIDVAENEINSILHDKKINDELRGFTRPDQSRHLNDDIETEIVDSLVSTTSLKFDIPERFYKLKAQLLGQTKLKYHERNVPIGEIETEYSFEDSVKLLKRVFQNLDNEFADIFDKFLKNGQIDVFPKENKSSGAFCAHNGINQPTFILLNHSNKLNDVLTIAHEVGHGINNELIRKKQKAIFFGTPTSTAEVSSTFMEDFVLDEILKQSDDEVRLNIIMTKLNDDVSTIFRQIACYKFELELHSKFREAGYLSKTDIGQIFKSNMKSYMGDFIEQSEGSETFWVAWSHIRNFFYVYSYASGLLISKYLQNSVKANHDYILQVKDFMSAGESESPKTIFNNLGLDISEKSFWNKGLNEIEMLLNEAEKLSQKLGKI